MSEKKKKCTGKDTCGQVKPLSEFYIRRGKPTGPCKECMKKRRRAVYENNKEKYIQQGKDYYKANRDAMIKAGREYYKTHREELIKNAIGRYSKKVKEEEGRAVRHIGPNKRTRNLLGTKAKTKK